MNRGFNWWNEEPIQYLLVAIIVLLFFPIVISAFLALITVFSSHPLAVKWRWQVVQVTLILVVIQHLVGQLLNDPFWYGFWSKSPGWLACIVLPIGQILKWQNLVPEIRIIYVWVLVSVIYVIALFGALLQLRAMFR